MYIYILYQNGVGWDTNCIWWDRTVSSEDMTRDVKWYVAESGRNRVALVGHGTFILHVHCTCVDIRRIVKFFTPGVCTSFANRGYYCIASVTTVCLARRYAGHYYLHLNKVSS